MKKLINFILLLFILFSIELVQQYNFESLEINGNSTKLLQKSGSISFSLKVNNRDILKQYQKISIKLNSKKNQIAILSENSICETGRKLLGMQPYVPVKLFFNKKQLENNKLYFCIQCLEENCQYSIKLKDEDSTKLKIGEQCSYYFNSTKTEMKFVIEVNTQNKLRNLEIINTFYNI